MGTMGYSLCQCNIYESTGEVHLNSKQMNLQHKQHQHRNQMKADNDINNNDNISFSTYLDRNTNNNNNKNINIKDHNDSNNEEDGPIDKNKITEYFIVNDDIIKRPSTSLSRNLSNYNNNYNLSSTLAYSNPTSHDQIHFEMFISENYDIDFAWESTDVSFILTSNCESLELLFYGELTMTQGYSSNILAAKQLTSFCVLTQKEMKVFKNKEEYHLKMKELITIDIRNVEQLVMFKEKNKGRKAFADNEIFYMGIVVKGNEGNGRISGSLMNSTSAGFTVVYVFWNEVKKMMCYWMKLLSILIKEN